jgi:SAM-dependent methyltransferase
MNKTEPRGFSTMTSSIEFADNYNRWIASKIIPYIKKSLLEVGTGQGNFKKFLDNYVEEYYSIDIDKNVVERARKRDPKGNYFQADITNFEQIKKLNRDFDLIILLNVLEHIKDDLGALKNLLKILEKDGYLFVFVPAFLTLYNDLDRLAGHYTRYRIEDFYKLADNLNAQIVEYEYFNPIGGIGWYFNKFVRHNDLDSKSANKQMQVFDKYVVPVSKTINPLSKRIFGQSLIIVLQKK